MGSFMILNERLTAIFSDLEQEISQVQQANCPALMGELERLRVVAWAKVICPLTPQPGQQCTSTPDRFLTVSEVEDRFSVSRKWLYRNKKRMPHSQPSRKKLLFPEQAITKWFSSRKVT